jgi:hypothetical protein
MDPPAKAKQPHQKNFYHMVGLCISNKYATEGLAAFLS